MTIFQRLHSHLRAMTPWLRRLGLLRGARLYVAFAAARRDRSSGTTVRVPLPWRGGPVYARGATSDLDVLVQVVLKGAAEFTVPRVPMRIIDGGANIGLVARAFHERWPDAEILAVELAAENLPILRDNLQAVTGARVIHGAVWGAVGEVCVANPEAEPWAFRASDVHPGEERVAAYSVTQLLDSVGWPTVDLLKLDIEGAEVEVFGSAHEWIHRVDCIAAELHDRFRPGCREAFDQALGPDWSVVQHSEYLVAHRSESVSGTLPPPLG